ncbi:FadR family transcriptional regulator [Blautia faecis]|jgi:GntR family transcriptional repressor for pyruvate dehydrogenase complex|uniref:FadR/GntR family transcriptional regulator n=1 Tax=Clostridia TaxID=186801 RepID=UPI000E522A3B|nr:MULTISPECIES: FadR/GntR family transcriptional regulator [Clostridia]MCB5480374.1 FadR family transcriptional regulator [Blautia faecis]RHT03307.1 FadR family transcriptional regulator [Ruminococcus sp. AM42-11]
MKAIQRMSITDSVVADIKEMIMSGEYKIGEKLPTEMKLCDQMGVSRTCVREAIRVLQAIGYVEIRPGKGAFVANYQKSTDNSSLWYDVEGVKFYDFMEVRMAIETLSVRLAVERATDKQIRELREIHTSFVEATEKRDMLKMIMLDELFHTKIITFTNNQLLININKQLLERFRIYRGDSFTNKMVYKNAVEPHERILLCFEMRNPSSAVEEMRKHLNITTQDMELIHNNSKTAKSSNQK